MHSASHLLRTPTILGAVVLLGSILTAAETPAADLSGHWVGRWQSCTTGHQGPLQADFCKIDSTRYQVTFRGRFFKIIPFKYTVVLTVVEEQGDTVRLAGNQYMGRRYGTFHYSATATGCQFRADYTSCRDDGIFTLTKCCP